MKRSRNFVLAAAALAMALSAHGQTAPGGSAGGTAKTPTYKETMVPYDKLGSEPRIVLLQNAIRFSREGFYKADTKPVAKEIKYNGSAVAAYSMSYPLALLTKGCAGSLTVVDAARKSRKIAARDFAEFFAIVDFTSGTAPVLYNPKSGVEIKDFLYAVTAEGEAIYSIVSGQTLKPQDVIKDAGWNVKGNYRYVAADKFHIPVGVAENATGELRGALSGAINGSFPDLKIAGGKINDILFIQAIK